MKTVKGRVSSQIVEKKSKFISDLYYIESEKDAEEKIIDIKKTYHDARHHCFAYRVLEKGNIIERASDDGEPSGTAGAPILQLLSKQELVNVLVVVTRYFGGILLGTGGLVRAYTQSANESIEKAKIVNIELGEILKIPISYQNLPYIQYHCGKRAIPVIKMNFDNEPYAIIEILLKEKDEFLKEMEKKQILINKIEVLNQKYLEKNV